MPTRRSRPPGRPLVILGPCAEVAQYPPLFMRPDTHEEVALDRFSTRIDPVMTALALLWLPVLVIPLVTQLHGSLAVAFDVADYFVWAAFAVEYVVKLRLAVDRWHFFRHHLLDLAMVAVPVLRPLRLARIFRLVRLSRVGLVLGGSLKRARALFTHHGLQFVFLTVSALVFAGAGLEVYFERHAAGPTAIHGFGDAVVVGRRHRHDSRLWRQDSHDRRWQGNRHRAHVDRHRLGRSPHRHHRLFLCAGATHRGVGRDTHSTPGDSGTAVTIIMSHAHLTGLRERTLG